MGLSTTAQPRRQTGGGGSAPAGEFRGYCTCHRNLCHCNFDGVAATRSRPNRPAQPRPEFRCHRNRRRCSPRSFPFPRTGLCWDDGGNFKIVHSSPILSWHRQSENAMFRWVNFSISSTGFVQDQDKSGIGRPRDFEYGAEVIDEDELVNFVEFKRVVTVRDRPTIAKRVRVSTRATGCPSREWIEHPLHHRLAPAAHPEPPTGNPVPLAGFSGVASRFASPTGGNEYQPGESTATGAAVWDFENWESREAYPKGIVLRIPTSCEK